MKEAGRNLWDLRTPMRDGVELSADVYLPADGLAGGPYPLVLVRTPDNNQAAVYVRFAKHLADRGFAVALQDVRGRHDSAGTFEPFGDEGRDGYDSIEWFAAQDWCNGKVGLFGRGYAAWLQPAAARERPPHLVTLVSAPYDGHWRETPYRNGLLSLPMLGWLHSVSARVWQDGSQVDWERVYRHLPLRSMDQQTGRTLPAWAEWLDHPRPTEADRGDIDIPSLRGTSALENLDDSAYLQWFTRWLKDDSSAAADEPTTPPAAIETSYFLHSAGGANSLAGDGTLTTDKPADEPADTYVYDPADPVVLVTDFNLFPAMPADESLVPPDRRFVDRRSDVVVYTSLPLEADLDVVGVPRVTLYAGSDCPDTDWFVQLTDVDGNGATTALAVGGLRARFRESLDRETFMAPGEVYEFPIELHGLAHTFKAGHRIRLSVTSSWFPLFSRNLNTGGPIADETDARSATNRVFHDDSHPSQLVLPVIS